MRARWEGGSWLKRASPQGNWLLSEGPASLLLCVQLLKTHLKTHIPALPLRNRRTQLYFSAPRISNLSAKDNTDFVD